MDDLDDSDWLFPSRQKNRDGVIGHVTAVQAYRLFKIEAVKLGIQNFGTHSIRKSFGYFYYHRTKDIGKLMQIFNHSSEKQTLDCIGVYQQLLDESLEDFVLYH